MKKETFLKKYGITEDQFSGKVKIEGDLYLSSLTSLPEGFAPTVGGDLDLRSLTSLPEGFAPTVGGGLDLRSLTSLPEGFAPTVGGGLYWKYNSKHIGANVPPIPPVPPVNRNFFWNVEEKKYAKIDGIFCEITNKKEDNFSGETYTVYGGKKVNKDEYFFVVNCGSFYAHGTDLRKAYDDLQFKMIAERLKKEPINADTIISVRYYRIVTGACEMGCKNWLSQNNLTESTEMKASELLPLLKKTDAYGYERFKKLVTF